MPPRLMLMTRAPLSTAQRIAFASASTGIVRDFVTTFATSSCADGARPAMPTPLSDSAPMRPATNVPCPSVSDRGGPADEALRVEDPPRRSGCVPSTPESMTATRTRRERWGWSHEVERRLWVAYHWRGRERVVREERYLPAPEPSRHNDTPRRARSPVPRRAPRRRAHESVVGRRSGCRREREVAPQPPRCFLPGDTDGVASSVCARNGKKEDSEGDPHERDEEGRPSGSLRSLGRNSDRHRRAGHAVRDEPIGRRELRPHGRDERAADPGLELDRRQPSCR